MHAVGLICVIAHFAFIDGSVIHRAKRQEVVTGGGTGVDAAYLASLLNGGANGATPTQVVNTGTGVVPGRGGDRISGGTFATEPPTQPPTQPQTTELTTKKPRRSTKKPKKHTTKRPRPKTTRPPNPPTTPEPAITTEETTELIYVDTTVYNIPETSERVTDFGFGDFETEKTDEPFTEPSNNFGEETNSNRGGSESAATVQPKGRLVPGGATKFGPVVPPSGPGTSQGIIPLLPEVSGGTNAEFFGVDAGTKKGFANGQGGKSAGAAIPGLGFFGGSKGGGLQGCGKVGGGRSVGIGNFGSVNKGTSVDLSAIPGIGSVLGSC